MPKRIENFKRDELLKMYQEYLLVGSAWKLKGKYVIDPQYFYRLIKQEGLPLATNRKWTVAEEAQLRAVYERGFKKGDGSLSALCDSLSRPKSDIVNHAKKLGLTNRCRKVAAAARVAMSEQRKQFYSTPEGKASHCSPFRDFTQEQRDLYRPYTRAGLQLYFRDKKRHRSAMAKAAVTRQARGTVPQPRNASWKAGYREIAGRKIYFRSAWEANYARLLEVRRITGDILDWHYERTQYILDTRSGTTTYIPDFDVTELDGTLSHHEVKGWMDERSKRKLSLMKRHHPTVKVLVIGRDFFNFNDRQAWRLIHDWESNTNLLLHPNPKKTMPPLAYVRRIEHARLGVEE
jgi:hypothetical protein